MHQSEIPSFAFPAGRIFSEFQSPTPPFYGFKIEKLSMLQKRLTQAEETEKSEKIQAVLWTALKVVLLAGAIAAFVFCPIPMVGLGIVAALIVCNVIAFKISEKLREKDDRALSDPRNCLFSFKSLLAGMPLLTHTLLTRKKELQENVSRLESEILEIARNTEKDYSRFKAQLEQREPASNLSNWKPTDLAQTLVELEKAHRLAQLLLNQNQEVPLILPSA